MPARAPEPPPAEVVYTFKVLSRAAGGGPRMVLFQRFGDGESIEICAETCAPNLLATLPDFLDAALDVRRSIRKHASLDRAAEDRLTARLAEEGRRAASLARTESVPPATPEDDPKDRGRLRLLGAAFRGVSLEVPRQRPSR